MPQVTIRNMFADWMLQEVLSYRQEGEPERVCFASLYLVIFLEPLILCYSSHQVDGFEVHVVVFLKVCFQVLELRYMTQVNSPRSFDL